MRLDNVIDIDQHGGSALLAIVLDDETEAFSRALAHGAFGRGGIGFGAHFVAAEGLEADRFQHMDAICHPADRGFPVNSFENAARRGRRHHIIRDALDLHLRSRKAGALTPNPQPDTKRHLQPPTHNSGDYIHFRQSGGDIRNAHTCFRVVMGQVCKVQHRVA